MVKKTLLAALILLGLPFCETTSVCFADAAAQFHQCLVEPTALILRQQFGRRLLQERSARFADRMVPWIEKGGTFFAVGAAHLPGADGVIALLRDRGFDVVAVY